MGEGGDRPLWLPTGGCMSVCVRVCMCARVYLSCGLTPVCLCAFRCVCVCLSCGLAQVMEVSPEKPLC